jgi:NAD(P)-dependent dehydrogenase (short-subunit alcohol dehydrogenase family)
VRVRRLDLLDRDSIAAFVAAWDGPLDILVNHDGIAPPPVRRLTDDGVEVQFALGHLAHLALTLGLFQALEAAAQASGEARVVAVSSAGHLRSPVVLDDLGFDRRAYDPGLAQAQAKTAVVLFAVAASRHWATDGITVNAVNGDGPAGPATTVLAAASPLLKGVGGRYLEDVGEAIAAGPAGRSGVAAHAVDPEAASCLWDTSLAMLAPWATAARMVPA